VTAVYKGTKKAGTGQILLRSYDSRKEPAVEPNATIWQAGRATCATALAFKPIQVGQSVFLDDGVGKYNPAPQILDEAVCNEWPGREVGVFISIGTGKRPEGTNQQQHLWWEGFVSSGMGDFAEARRRLVSKIEDCEKTHLSMKDKLAKRQVNPENYYRLNVNVGVGEFGMNEWNRLAEISTNTRMYLAEPNVQSQNLDAAAKIARIHRAKLRYERAERGQPQYGTNNNAPTVNLWERPLSTVPDASPIFAELPAEDVDPHLMAHHQHHPAMLSPSYGRRTSGNDKFMVVSSDEYPQHVSDLGPRHSGELVAGNRRSQEMFSTAPEHISSLENSPRISFEQPSPPPRPPKTPLNDMKAPNRLSGPPTLPPPNSALPRPPQGIPLPYPDTDGPPPMVNKARKPEYIR
jgi:hypothetical protein